MSDSTELERAVEQPPSGGSDGSVLRPIGPRRVVHLGSSQVVPAGCLQWLDVRYFVWAATFAGGGSWLTMSWLVLLDSGLHGRSPFSPLEARSA